MYNNNYIDGIKFFYEDVKALKKLERDLFKALINIPDDSPNNKKYKKLVIYLVKKITTCKPTPSFPIYVCDITDEINEKLDQLPEPVLYDFMNNLIDKIFKYSLRKETIFNYQYFVEKIQDKGYLKWRFI
jgi:hypothetical protein